MSQATDDPTTPTADAPDEMTMADAVDALQVYARQDDAGRKALIVIVQVLALPAPLRAETLRRVIDMATQALEHPAVWR